MSIKAKHWYIFSFSFILLLGIGLLVIELYKNTIYEFVEKETFLKGQIIKIKNSHGSCYVELNNKRKVFIPQSKNYKYSPPGFSDIAFIGDSLIKDVNNDTLYLIKNKRKFIFKVGSALNIHNKE